MAESQERAKGNMARPTTATPKRFNCKCCKYKEEFRLLVTDFINNDFSNEDLQKLCSHIELPITKPGEWELLDSAQTFVRPAVLWALSKQKFIKKWSQRPNKLQQILTVALRRNDMNSKLQDLLDKRRTVGRCLQKFQSTSSGENSSASSEAELVLAIQETQLHEEQEVKQNPANNCSCSAPIQEDGVSTFAQPELVVTHPTSNLPLIVIQEEAENGKDGRDRTISTVSTLSIASSGFHDRTFSSRTMSTISTASSISRNDSGISVTNNRVSIVLPDVEFDFDKAVEKFCKDCREWINSISPEVSPRSSPTNTMSLTQSCASTTDAGDQYTYSGNDSSSMSPTCSLECSAHTYLTSEKSIKLNKKDLLKNTSVKSRLFPNMQSETKDYPVKCKIKLQPQASTAGATNAQYTSLSIHLKPEKRSCDAIQIPPLNVNVKVYATNKKNETFVIIKDEASTEEISVTKTTQIVEFSELFDIDYAKKVLETDEDLKLEYVIVQVNISMHYDPYHYTVTKQPIVSH